MDTFFDTLFSRLAHASVQALLLAAIVYAVCRLMPTLSAATRSTLWWLLGAQLVVGIACPTVLGLPLLPAQAPMPTTAISMTWNGDPGISSLPGQGWTFSWTYALLGVWMLAVLAQVGIAAFRWQRLAGVIGRAMPHDDVRVDTLCARRARELGLRRSPRLAVSDEVDSPQVMGLWRPTILLPQDDRLDDDELDMALTHELAHIRRGDLVLGWIPALARTLFFFHPLVHLAVREYALCREAACDALVVSRGRQAPRSYGRLLVRLGVTPHPHHALPGASPTFQSLKRRLDMLSQTNDTPPRILTWCLVVAIAAVGVLPWRVVAADSGVTASHATTTPPAPPAPPVAPDTLGVPPIPPTPPAPLTPPSSQTFSKTSMQVTDIRGDNPEQAFLFFSDNVNVMSGSASDFRRAEADRSGSEAYAWYRDGKQAWVLRDPAYIKRISAVYARSAVPADQGKMSADKQMELDRRQAVLNEQMAKLSERQSELARKETQSDAPTDHAAYAEGHAAVAREQAAVARQMAEIGKLRAAQGQVQAEWGRRQAEAARKGNLEVQAILDEAVRNHVAQAAR